MTAYHGGKQKIGEQIALTMAHLTKSYRPEFYIEPFCGMLGVYRHIPGTIKARYYLAGDVNNSVIKMWQAVQRGWRPPTECDRQLYETLKYDKRSSAKKGFLGFALGFRGIYFNTMRNDVDLRSTSRRVAEVGKRLANVRFLPGDYAQFTNVRNAIIYCDPPYVVQHIYKDDNNQRLKFDHAEFYEWVQYMAQSNVVFISERLRKLPINAKLVAEFADGENLFMV